MITVKRSNVKQLPLKEIKNGSVFIYNDELYFKPGNSFEMKWNPGTNRFNILENIDSNELCVSPKHISIGFISVNEYKKIPFKDILIGDAFSFEDGTILIKTLHNEATVFILLPDSNYECGQTIQLAEDELVYQCDEIEISADGNLLMEEPFWNQ